MGSPRNKTLGCFAIGCLSIVILGIVMIVGISYWTKNALNTLVNNYTDEAPLVLPEVEISEEDLQSLVARVEAFRKALDENETDVRLELTPNELNALILHDSEMEKLKGKVYLDIQDRQLVGEVSLPLEEFDIPFGAGRFFNGYGVFDVTHSERGLSVIVEELLINSKPLPEGFMKGFQGQNVLEKAKLDDEAEAFLDRIKSFEILEDRIVLEVSPESSEPDAEVENAAELELIE